MNKYIVFGSVTALCGILVAYIYSRRKKTYANLADEDSEDEECELCDKDVLVLGIEGSGKSTILESLSGNSSEEPTPTEGFNVVSFPGPNGNRINLFELGGSSRTRHYWRHFYSEKSLVVYVVDASSSSLTEAKEIFHELLSDSNLDDLPFVLVAHKQDLSNAVDGDAVLKAMEVKKFTQAGRNIYPLQTQTPYKGKHSGVEELKNLVLNLL